MNKLAKSLAGNAAAMAAYAILAIASTWPLASDLKNRLPLGSEDARTVPYFNMWTIGWNSQAMLDGRMMFSQDYWDAGIFFPSGDALAMSEAQPATAFLAPLWFGFESGSVAYNVYLLLSLTLNGWVTFYLLKRMGFHPWIALGAGVSMLLLPMVHWQIGVLQLVPIWACVWGLSVVATVLGASPSFTDGTNVTVADDRIVDRATPEPRRSGSSIIAIGFGLGLSFTFAFWMCVHHGLMLVVLAVVASLPFALAILRWPVLATLGIAVVFFAIGVTPIAWKHRQVAQRHGFTREAKIIEELSAQPGDYLAAYGRTYGSMFWQAGRAWYLSAGWPLMFSASLALILGVFARKRYGAWIVYWTTILGVAFALSLGANLRWGEWNAWQSLADTVPGLAQIRSVYRFAYFVQIAAVMLAATSFELLRRQWLVPMFMEHRKMATLLASLFLVLGTWVACDPWPYPLRLAEVPPRLIAKPAWLATLSAAEDGGVLVLPIRYGGSVQEYEETTVWMLQSLQHHKPLVNGYSGFFPDDNTRLAGRCVQEGMSAALRADLRQLGVRYVLVQPEYVGNSNDDWAGMTLLSNPADPTKLYEL